MANTENNGFNEIVIHHREKTTKYYKRPNFFLHTFMWFVKHWKLKKKHPTTKQNKTKIREKELVAFLENHTRQININLNFRNSLLETNKQHRNYANFKSTKNLRRLMAQHLKQSIFNRINSTRKKWNFSAQLNIY